MGQRNIEQRRVALSPGCYALHTGIDVRASNPRLQAKAESAISACSSGAVAKELPTSAIVGV
eukprot:2160314-Pleurochrysis_carterae.AAC.1